MGMLWAVLFLVGVSPDQDTPMQAWTQTRVWNSSELLMHVLTEAIRAIVGKRRPRR